MNIRKLKNPKTAAYVDLKNFVLSDNFAWYYSGKSVLSEQGASIVHDQSDYHNVPFFSHRFLIRPETNETKFKFPKANSTHTEHVANVFLEILNFNGIKINSFFRLNANCVLPFKEVVNTTPHVDHDYPHKNAIIYLTDAGGKIFVENEFYDPEEDDVVLFDGLTHYHQSPEHGNNQARRICLVATFF